MMDLFIAEAKKLYRPWNHRLIVLFVLLFPFLYMVFSTLPHVQEQSLQRDDIRMQIEGVVNEQWFLQVENKYKLLNQSGSIQEQMQYQTLKDAYWSGVMILDLRQSVLEDATTPSLVKEDLKKSELQYGPYENWLSHFDVLSMSALLYGICCIYLFCNLFNQEDANGAIDLLKSSKKGRNPLSIAKLSLAIITSVGLGVASYTMVQIASSTMLTNLNGDVSIPVMNRPQYLTFGEANQIFFWLVIMGGLVCTMLATWCSSITKNMHISLAIGLLTYIIPSMTSLTLFQTNIARLFPISFLWKSKGILVNPWLNINTFYHHAEVIITTVWIPIILCIIGFVIHHQKHQHIHHLAWIGKVS